MSKNCMITFDQNEHGTYFTGQVVTGKVIVNLTKTKKLRGIKLQISGLCLGPMEGSKTWQSHAHTESKEENQKHVQWTRGLHSLHHISDGIGAGQLFQH
ncbi:GL12454 [Drosophila persimilis]|uniref:GL12454 n=1 Tax=Drosophila persimilis TaxID=7234 RepID=B4GMW2_DROPE|nr:GL12454 [Drosophila persimilis]